MGAKSKRGAWWREGDQGIYLARRSLPAGRTSTLKKMAKAKRLAASA